MVYYDAPEIRMIARSLLRHPDEYTAIAIVRTSPSTDPFPTDRNDNRLAPFEFDLPHQIRTARQIAEHINGDYGVDLLPADILAVTYPDQSVTFFPPQET